MPNSVKIKFVIKAIIFDLNGVFIQSRFFSVRMSEKYGVDVDEYFLAQKGILQEVHKSNAPRVFNLWKPYFDKWNLKLTEEEFLKYWFSGESLVPELLDYANKLKLQGLKIFILSNNFKERTTYYRENFPQLFAEFDGVYFSWETGFVKSSPEAYLNVLNKNGLEAGECVFFDDSDKNIELAKSLGIFGFKYIDLQSTKVEVNNLLRG